MNPPYFPPSISTSESPGFAESAPNSFYPYSSSTHRSQYSGQSLSRDENIHYEFRITAVPNPRDLWRSVQPGYGQRPVIACFDDDPVCRRYLRPGNHRDSKYYGCCFCDCQLQWKEEYESQGRNNHVLCDNCLNNHPPDEAGGIFNRWKNHPDPIEQEPKYADERRKLLNDKRRNDWACHPGPTMRKSDPYYQDLMREFKLNPPPPKLSKKERDIAEGRWRGIRIPKAMQNFKRWIASRFKVRLKPTTMPRDLCS
jgi:hypothetical protein